MQPRQTPSDGFTVSVGAISVVVAAPEDVTFAAATFALKQIYIYIYIKRKKNKNTTLSEQFQDPIETS